MRKAIFHLAGALALLVCLPAQASADGSISGTLVDSAGAPVVDYCVGATRVTANSSHGLIPVRTNSAGRFTVTQGVSAGNYRLRFERCFSDSVPANRDLIPEYYDDRQNLEAADLVPVAEGEHVTGIDAELQIGASLAGTVRGPDGQPIRACVQIHGPGVAHGLQTLPTGEFRFDRLRAGDFQVFFDDCGDEHGLAGEWYENKATRSEADPVSLAAAEQRTGFDATLGEGGSIEGTVTGQGGAPLSGVCVRIFDGDGKRYSSLTTDAEGGFAAGAVAPGRYRVGYSNCHGSVNVAPEFYDDSATLAGAQELVVTEGSELRADAVLAAGGSISGVVRGPDQRPLDGACVQLFDPAGSEVGYARTDDDGSYAIDSLATLAYRVQFDPCGEVPGAGREYWENRATLGEADPIQVTAGAERGGVNATLGAPDPVVPETSIVAGPPAGATVGSSRAEFGFAASVAGSRFECRLDGGKFAPCPATHVLHDLADGRHVLAVRAISPAGLVDATPAQRSFRVDVAACLSAQAALERSLGVREVAERRLQAAKRALRRALRSGGSKRVARARARVRAAKVALGAARNAVTVARDEVARRCPG